MSRTHSLTDYINSLWKDAKASPSYAELKEYRLNLDDIIKQSRELSDDDQLLSINNWVAATDSILNWLIWTVFSWHEQYIVRSQNNRENNAPLVYLTVLGTCLHEAIAIRELCLGGFDLPAKQVLRAFGEYRDLLLLFDADPAVIADFNSAHEPEQANKFWHKVIKSGKARKHIETFRASNEIGKVFATADYREWYLDDQKLLGASIHPSSAAAFACYTGLHSRNAWPPILGMKSPSSTRTLRHLYFGLLELALSPASLHFWEAGHPIAGPTFDPSNQMHKTAFFMYAVVLQVGRWISEHHDDPALAPEELVWE